MRIGMNNFLSTSKCFILTFTIQVPSVLYSATNPQS